MDEYNGEAGERMQKDYKTVTISKKIGACGHIYCLFMEDENAFHKLHIKGDPGKMPCGGCFLEALGRVLTYALRRGIWEGSVNKGLINQLLNIRCNDLPVNAEHICSCPDAIGKSIKEYLKYEEPKKPLPEEAKEKV